MRPRNLLRIIPSVFHRRPFVPTTLDELWALFAVSVPSLFGDRTGYRRTFRTPIEKHGDADRQRVLARRVRPFLLRRTKEEVAAELPPKTEILEAVEPGGAQRDLYETIRLTMDHRVRDEVARKGGRAAASPSSMRC